MVKDHSDIERGNPLSPHMLLFPISSKCTFICIMSHTTASVTPVVEHWMEREIAKIGVIRAERFTIFGYKMSGNNKHNMAH